MNTDNDCEHTYNTNNGKLNEGDAIIRKVASMFIGMVARNIWHSTMNRDVRPIQFSVPFTMSSGEYIGSIDCKNHQKYSIEGLYVFLLNDAKSILDDEKPFPDHYDISVHMMNAKRMADGIVQQIKNNVRLSVYNSNVDKDTIVITIKRGSYHLETRRGSTNNLTIDVEVEEEIKFYVEDNEFIKITLGSI